MVLSPQEPEQTEALPLVVSTPKKKRSKVTDTRLSPRAARALLHDGLRHQNIDAAFPTSTSVSQSVSRWALSDGILRKNVRISADILWRVYHILTEPVPYTFASVNRRNNEAPAHIAMSDLRTQTEPVPLKSPQNIRGYTDIFTV